MIGRDGKPMLTSSATELLRRLVAEERAGIKSGEISYGGEFETDDVLSDLVELDELCDYVGTGSAVRR